MRFSSLVLVCVLGCTTSPASEPIGGGGGKADDATLSSGPPANSVQHFLRTPLVRQATEYTCGVASLLSVLGYYGVPDINEGDLATKLGSDPDGGTNYREIVEYARSVGLTVTTKTNMTIAELTARIDQKHPVMLALQAWVDDPATVDWTETFENGHYVVATGYDAENIYFMDPYMRGTYTFIPRAQLEQRWHDGDGEGPLEHFGILFSGRQPAYDPERTVQMP
ncbi:MAG: C39 family peptidase [Deltaproteobacteria bacterium]|nr:C39 family peptidase [Deltaproteobacteria bacterium]